MNDKYNDEYENEKYPGDEFGENFDEFPNDEYDEYSYDEYDDEEYIEDEYINDEYAEDEYINDEYAEEDYADDEYIGEDYIDDEYAGEDYTEEGTVRYVDPEFVGKGEFSDNNNYGADPHEYFEENYGYNDAPFEHPQNFEHDDEHRNKRMKSRENRQHAKGSGKKKLLLKFLIIFFSIIFLFMLLIAAVWFGFRASGEDGQSAVVGFFQRHFGVEDETLIDWNLLPPVKTNVLVLGVDDEASLTDTMFLATFDRETLRTDVISLPRDSWVELDEELFSRLRIQSAGRSMRLNAIYNKAVPGEGGDIVRQHVEQMLGITIHHWVSMDLAGFRAVVDTMGGVYMEVRPQGLHYFDPCANFRINIPGGFQRLDGVAAEGFVRFRTFPEGDLERIRMQQDFMSAFMDQLLTRDVLLENAFDFLGILISHVNTDFNVFFDLPKYIAFIPSISVENLTFHMLPGESTTITPGGVRTAVYLVDFIATRELIDKIFYGTPEPIAEDYEDEPEETTAGTSIDKPNTRIQVLNGAGVAGLASSFSDKLTAEGYNIVNIGNYSGSSRPETRIIVRTQGWADELKQFFNSAVEQVAPTLPDAFDIIIIIGTSDR